jgi:hypothetical protein
MNDPNLDHGAGYAAFNRLASALVRSTRASAALILRSGEIYHADSLGEIAFFEVAFHARRFRR